MVLEPEKKVTKIGKVIDFALRGDLARFHGIYGLQ